MGKEAAYKFLNDKTVIDAFEQLRAAYEGQDRAGGLTSANGWQAYWDQFAERISGKGAWYRSQEAEWFEAVAQQGLELESLVNIDSLIFMKRIKFTCCFR